MLTAIIFVIDIYNVQVLPQFIINITYQQSL